MPKATRAEVVSDDALARASGRLRVAIQRLTRHHPLHAALAARADLAADERAEGLTLRAGRPALVLAFNPTFVQGCSQDELASAIKQTCDRLVSRHLDASDEDVDVDDPSIAAVSAEIKGFARALIALAMAGAIDALSPDERAALPAATRNGRDRSKQGTVGGGVQWRVDPPHRRPRSRGAREVPRRDRPRSRYATSRSTSYQFAPGVAKSIPSIW